MRRGQPHERPDGIGPCERLPEGRFLNSSKNRDYVRQTGRKAKRGEGEQCCELLEDQEANGEVFQTTRESHSQAFQFLAGIHFFNSSEIVVTAERSPVFAAIATRDEMPRLPLDVSSSENDN
jgi:hypothetical protein